MLSKRLFQRYQTSITVTLLGMYFLINGAVNSTTVLMEALRNPPLPFDRWEPFVWEYTSAVGSFLLVLGLAYCLRRFPWNWHCPFLSLAQYCALVLGFSALHVAFMITSREAIYAVLNKDYNFAKDIQEWIFELVYEFHKDIWSFIFFVLVIGFYRYIVTQWLGDAKNINIEITETHDETSTEKRKNNGNKERAQKNVQSRLKETDNNDFLLIKKLGREFLIKKHEIEWVASSGNYLNLYVGEQTFPMRATFKGFLEQDTYASFRRVHRSYAVNMRYVDNITVSESGDGIITLTSRQTVKMSRRYKLALD